jgi:hypothetical protein
VTFVKFEEVHGKEMYVNFDRVNYISESGDRTVIHFDGEQSVTVQLTPAQVMTILVNAGSR